MRRIRRFVKRNNGKICWLAAGFICSVSGGLAVGLNLGAELGVATGLGLLGFVGIVGSSNL